MGRPILIIKLESEEQSELQRRVRSGKTSQRNCLRTRIFLIRTGGKKQQNVADGLGVIHVIVSKWTKRFMQKVYLLCVHPMVVWISRLFASGQGRYIFPS